MELYKTLTRKGIQTEILKRVLNGEKHASIAKYLDYKDIGYLKTKFNNTINYYINLNLINYHIDFGIKRRNGVEKKCSFCNKDIYVPNRHLKDYNFCSQRCYYDWKSENIKGDLVHNFKMRVKSECKNCHKIFEHRHDRDRIFCNKDCLNEWNRENSKSGKEHHSYSKIDVNCSFCDNTLSVTKAVYNKQDDFFCDMECRKKMGSITVNCSYCDKSIIKHKHKLKSNEDFFCDRECHRKNQMFSTIHNNRKVALYEKYVDELNFCEECRRHPDNNSILQMKCLYCDRWFTPSFEAVSARISHIRGKVPFENRLYCSDACKSSCSIFGQILYPKGFKEATSREVQPALRQLVLARDNWECIKCGKGVEAKLHCHHLEGVELNPVLSADLDMCVTLCRDCHRAAHSEKNCGYNDFKRKPC